MVLVDLSYITPGAMLAAAIIPTVLSMMFLAIRFDIRRRSKQVLKSDDWLLVSALVGSTACEHGQRG